MEQAEDRQSRLLAAVQRGDRSAPDDLYSLVYPELRVLAHRQRRRWDAGGMLRSAENQSRDEPALAVVGRLRQLPICRSAQAPACGIGRNTTSPSLS